MPSGLSSVDLYTSSVEPTLTGENTHTHTRHKFANQSHARPMLQAPNQKKRNSKSEMEKGTNKHNPTNHSSSASLRHAKITNSIKKGLPPSLPPSLPTCTTYTTHKKQKKTRLIGLVSVHDLPEMLKPVGRHAIVEDGVRVGQHVATTEPVLATLERRTSRDAW